MRVLVHADDLGLSPAVNDAIARACREGWVQSVSVLALAPAAEAGAKALPAGTDLGVHLDLTAFPSLTRADALDEVRSLAREGGAALLAALDRLPNRAPGVLEAEWEAQVETARAWASPSHLDSHQHVHWRPSLWAPLQRVLRRTGIAAVRGVAPWRPGASLPRRAAQRARAAHFQTAFRAFVTTDGPVNPATFRWLLERPGVGPGVVELMVHPGNDAHAGFLEEAQWLAAAWPDQARRTPPVRWVDLVSERGERAPELGGRHP